MWTEQERCYRIRHAVKQREMRFDESFPVANLTVTDWTANFCDREILNAR
ncbi:hypothetical protein N9B45_02855 [bacterium]|nr:hypothetical protein [bacterium]